MADTIPDWWRLDETPEQLYARALWHFREYEHLVAQLPTNYFADPFARRHGDPLRGEDIEAAEIEGVSA